MNKKDKTILIEALVILALVLALLVLLLRSCGQKKETTGSPETVTEETQAEAEQHILDESVEFEPVAPAERGMPEETAAPTPSPSPTPSPAPAEEPDGEGSSAANGSTTQRPSSPVDNYRQETEGESNNDDDDNDDPPALTGDDQPLLVEIDEAQFAVDYVEVPALER